ncbi:ethanolamine utilization protein EutH [Rossellomorea sp. BNER]|uniref:ethanolamine utilization protein EutH n=1 Tax=Rossellomorea sp. BNER TaxID=2962031 RepID=UPI003AF23D6A|nr:ethanolamine utilization protein EutH [Rossellomorea sp. BNER]
MSNIIIIILSIFMVIGAVDKVLGNKIGLGEKFTEAFQSMGMLALSMIGIISLSPVLANILIPIITPVYELIGADPSMFASTILALDMGGYSLAMEMAKSSDAATFSWVFLGTTMGATIVFTIPVALGLIEKTDYHYFSKGILIGLANIPVGCMIGGVFAGYDLKWMLINLIPTLIFSTVIILGMIFLPLYVIKTFKVFSKGIESLIMIGLILIMLETSTGIQVVKGLLPFSEGMNTVGMITITLAGAFPFVLILQKVLTRPFIKIGERINVNKYSLIGLLASLAHLIPAFMLFKEMDGRGKVIVTAFAVSGAFVFGSHLGFVATMEKEMVLPMIIGKLSAGFLSIISAVVFTKEKSPKGSLLQKTSRFLKVPI